MSAKTPTLPEITPGAGFQAWSPDNNTHGDVSEWPELQVPPEIAEKPHATVHEIIDEIQVDFDIFWGDCVREAEKQGGMFVGNKNKMTVAERARYDKMDEDQRRFILDKSDRQRSFDSEVLWADFMITHAFALDDEHPEAQLVFDFDIDDVIGKQREEGNEKWLADLPEMEGVNYKKPAPEHEVLIRQLTLREQARRMVFRAALGPVTRLIYGKLNYVEDRIRFGLSSSHSQFEMREYLAPRLHALCPGFADYEMMSTVDSPVVQRVHEDMAARLAALQKAAVEANQVAPTHLSYADMIHIYPELEGLFDLTNEATLKKLNDGQLDKQGAKPFMAALRVRELAEEGFHGDLEDDFRGDTIVVQIDDWPIFAVAANKSEYVRAWHLGRRMRFALPGQRGYTNANDMRALLRSLGLKARH